MNDDHRELLNAAARVVDASDGTMGWSDAGREYLNHLLLLVREQSGGDWPIDPIPEAHRGRSARLVRELGSVKGPPRPPVDVPDGYYEVP